MALSMRSRRKEGGVLSLLWLRIQLDNRTVIPLPAYWNVPINHHHTGIWV
jgi:hypothetical protein